MKKFILPKVFKIRKTLLPFAIGIVVILIPIIYLISKYAKPVEAAWFDETWSYRQKSTITNGGGAQADFQISVTMSTSALISAGKMQSDCDDIRLVSSSGTLLPIWIEPSTCNGASTIIWTKIPWIEAGTSTLYIYYGNSQATSIASPTTVFVRDFDSIQGAWNMDEASGTRADSSGNGNTLTDNFTVTSNPGQYDTAAQFTAANTETLTRANNATIQAGDIAFTWSGWFYWDDVANIKTILTKDNGGANREYWVYTENDEIIFAINDSVGAFKAVIHPLAVPVSTWHFFVAWHDPSVDTIYVQVDNGEINTASVGGAAVAASTGALTFGGIVPAQYMNGRLDQMRYYKRLFSVEERADLANSSYSSYFTSNYANHELLRKYVASNAPTTGTPLGEEVHTGPIGYWKFDEGTDNTCIGNVNDTCDSMAKNDGAISNGAAWRNEEMCISGKCLEFDSNDDVVNLGSATIFDDMAAFTTSTWIRPNSTGEGGFGRIISKQDNNALSAKGWIIYTGGPSIIFSVGYNNGGNTLDCQAGITLNAWQLVNVSWDGTNSCNGVKIYINGSSQKLTQSSTPTGSRDTDATYNLLVGNESGGTRTFDGFIDEVKVYNHVKTAAQVKAEYISRGSQKDTSVQIGNGDLGNTISNGLVSYWKMDETSGNAADSSTNGTTMTNTNTATYTMGKFSYAGTLASASSQYFTAADNANISMGDIDTTFTAWVNATTLGANRDILTKWGVAGTNAQLEWQLMFDNTANRFLFNVGDGSSTNGTVAANNFGAPTTSTWYFVVAQHDAKNDLIKISVNGGEMNTASWSTGIQDNSYNLSIGRAGANNFNYWNGKIDEVRIYKRLLSPTEIADLYDWAPGPVGHWKMDENRATTAYDSSGNSNSATLTGGATWGTGKYGAAMNLSGTTQYATVANNASFSLTGQGLTMETWFYMSAANANNGLINRGSFASTQGTYSLLLFNGGSGTVPIARLNGNTVEGSGQLTGTTIFAVGNWYHLAVTYDQSRIRMYVNGVLDNSNAYTTAMSSDSNSLILGGYFSTSFTLNGKMDDTRIYNYPRTPKQIVQDLNAGHPTAGSPVASQVGYWNLDEQQGQTVNDKGLGANNGTLGANSSANTDDPTWKVAGSSTCKINGCLSFDGGDFVNIPDNADLRPENGSWTVTVWAKTPSGAPGVDKILVAKRQSSGAFEMWNLALRDSDGALQAYLVESILTPIQRISSSTVTVSDGNWHHLAAVFDKDLDKIRLFKDGTELGITTSNVGAWPTVNNTDPMRIGEGNGCCGYSDSIDEVKVYNTALTADEIKTDYNAGSSMSLGGIMGTQDNEGFGGNPPAVSWKFDENTGTTSTADYSGNTNTGTLTAMTGSSWVPGKIGSSLTFNGSSSYVRNTGVTFNPSSPFTLSMWIYPTAIVLSSAWAEISSGTTCNGNPQLWVANGAGGSVSGDLVLGRCGNGAGPTLGAATGFLNAWNHITFVYDGTNTRAYKNGVLTNTYAFNWPSIATSRLTIGASRENSLFYTGKMDEVRLYNYARTQAQVSYDYNRGAPLGLYKFDECQGTTAYNSAIDSNGKAAGFNGTITPGAGSNTSAGTCNSNTTSEMWSDGSDTTRGTSGKYNASLGFDGTDDYISIGNISAYNSSNLTWAAWVKTTTDSAIDIISNSDPTGNNEYIALCLGGGCSSVITDELITIVHNPSDARAGYVTTNRNELFDDNWHHVVMVANGSSYILYLDGIARPLTVGQGSNDGTTNVASYAMTAIGAVDRASTGTYFTGQMDDVRIYNYALSANQVKLLMNEGAAVRFGPQTGSP